MKAYAYNPSTWEAKPGELHVQVQPKLHKKNLLRRKEKGRGRGERGRKEGKR